MDEIQYLLETYPTREKLAEAMHFQILQNEHLTEQLEEERDRKSDATLTARIADLERALATMNERVGRQFDEQLLAELVIEPPAAGTPGTTEPPHEGGV